MRLMNANSMLMVTSLEEFDHLFTRFVLKCELNLPSVDVSSLPQVLDIYIAFYPHILD